jgi:hypothetical protein
MLRVLAKGTRGVVRRDVLGGIVHAYERAARTRPPFPWRGLSANCGAPPVGERVGVGRVRYLSVPSRVSGGRGQVRRT